MSIVVRVYYGRVVLDLQRIPGVELNRLTEVLAQVEKDHHQLVPMGTTTNLPVGCSCGIEYKPEQAWADSRTHLLRMRAFAALDALYRACEDCAGTGVHPKLRDTLCIECTGTGVIPTPLPPLQFRDTSGRTWSVELDAESLVTHRAFVTPQL